MNKKLILSISIIVILLNALLPHYIYADTTSNAGTGTAIKMESLEGQNARKEMKNENQQDVESSPINISLIGGVIADAGSFVLGEAGNMISRIMKVVAKVFCIIPYSVHMLISFVVLGDNEEMFNVSNFAEHFDASKINWFTIEKAVYGKVPIFNVDFFDVNNRDSEASTNFKGAVASWYQVTFRLAQILSIVVLIYIGIRMAMASNPDDKVNYKKMFKNWVVGFALLFLLHYGIVFILKATTWIISLIPESLVNKNFETQIVGRTIGLMDIWDSTVSIWSVLVYVITYYVIVGFEVYFFFKYFKRLFTMGFLVIIAPLITVTYAIDKADDGQAQAYGNWIKLFCSNAFMQAVHAFMYAIFTFSAATIAEKAPLIAIIFFIGLTKGEEVFNKLFGVGK